MEQGRFEQFIKPEKPDSPKRYWRLYGGIAALILLILIIIIALVTQINDNNAPKLTTLATLTTSPTIIATNTNTPTPKSTSTATFTLTPTTKPTDIPTATVVPSVTPTLTPAATASSTPDNIITAICNCEFGNIALFIAPDSNSTQLGTFVEKDEMVTVLGRATIGSWIYVEFEGVEGWVDARQFEISVQFEQLEVAETPFPTWTPTTNSPGITSTTNPTVFAYWQVTSSNSTEDGRWKTILALRVPRGGSYAFSFADLDVTFQFVRQVENGFDLYDVTISGMSCAGDLVGDLIVKRNGQQLTVRNEHTNQSGAVFVSAPDC